MKKLINPVLILLILLDVVYVCIIFPFPDLWFKIIHGVAYTDPEGLLRRTAAVWGAFALFQTIALLRWRKHPHWLMLVAGIRATEILSDFAYVYFAHDLTAFGRSSLLTAGPVNVLAAWFFFQSYLKITATSRASS